MRIVMMGTGMFAEPTFEALLAGPHPVVGLVTQPDRSVGQERGSTRQLGRGMKTIAAEKSIPVIQPESINTPEGLAGLQALQPDLLVVAAYGQILSKEVLGVPAHGGINVHASLLPKYRGAAPIAWAIYHGERETGVTIIRMTIGLDAGDMLAQQAISIGADETAGELEARLAPLGAQLAIMVIGQMQSGKVSGIPQDKSQATKAPKLTKEHGLLDWSRPARDVCNQIRAMSPWPTAYTFLHWSKETALRFIVHRAVPLDRQTELPPGQLLLDEPKPTGLRVATGAGTAVEILELQPAGKKRMAAMEFLRGVRLHQGDHLGSAAL